GARCTPYKRLQPVEAIDNDGLKLVLSGQQFLEHAKHVVQIRDDARRSKFDVGRRALAFRSEIERAGELSRQAGLSDTVHAIQKNDGRVVTLGGFQAAKADSHSISSCCGAGLVGRVWRCWLQATGSG